MLNRWSIGLSGIAALAIAGLCTAPSDAYAQRAGADRSGEEQQETRRVPAMRVAVGDTLSEAQECAEEGDFQCARRLLERVRGMRDLNAFERAQMWNFFGFIYVNEENFREAITAYENVLEQIDEIPAGLANQAMETLAMLYYQEERYQDALDMLDRWLAVTENPQPQSYILKATIYYQMRRFREGIPEVQRALEIARERNQPPQEQWYSLLQAFYFEVEDYPSLIQTLRFMAERWPKRDYFVQLAGIYGQEGEEDLQLALFEAAYEAGWLTRGSDLVTLANMLMQANTPYKAGQILSEGLEDGTIDSTEANWRTLSQAWQMAQEHERALPALTQAARMTNDGELDRRLAESYQNLARWDDCADAARSALDKGGLNRPDTTRIVLGICLTEQKQYPAALEAFQAAQRDDRSREVAGQWIRFVQNERERERQVTEALAQQRR